MLNSFRKAAVRVFACGVILRVALALVNSDANDRHMDMIKIMAYENRIPETYEDREGFQPKLYHVTVAALLKVVPLRSDWLVIRIGQLVSCLAGILTLIFAYRFLMQELEITNRVRLISFSLLALNPVLIGINGQATNDSFVILFVSLASYFAWHFFSKSANG